jgi:sulfate transport system ATP-binding protein
LILTDGSLRAQAALDLGGQIARLAHARVTLIGYGKQDETLGFHLQEARKQLGSGLAALEVITSEKGPAQAIRQAVERQPHDLVVMGFNYQEDLPLAEKILEAGEHHVLLVPGPQPAPGKALICVSSGEPGKDDVLFAGRLVRHLSADATLMTVIQATRADQEQQARTERFLESGVRSLSVLGVPAKTVLRTGTAPQEIRAEAREGGFDLVVLGAPLASSNGGISLTGVIGETLKLIPDIATLIVRSHYMARGVVYS